MRVGLFRATFVLLLPVIANAEGRFTLKCEGRADSWIAVGRPELTSVTHYYTLYVHGSTGRYYDWQRSVWQSISSIDVNTYTLEAWAETRESITIDRIDGAWRWSLELTLILLIILYTLILVRARVPLRVPPSPKF